MVLIGDFNIDLLDFDKNKRVQSFANLMFRFGMIPAKDIILGFLAVKKLIRVARHTATAFDQVLLYKYYHGQYRN